MNYTQVFFEKPDHLLCVSDGIIGDADDFIAWATTFIQKAMESKQKRLLIDNRTLFLDVSSLDVITFAKHLEKIEAAKLGFRIAVLSSPKNVGTSRLVETALVNRSATYKTFQNQEEAKEWLGLNY